MEIAFTVGIIALTLAASFFAWSFGKMCRGMAEREEAGEPSEVQFFAGKPCVIVSEGRYYMLKSAERQLKREHEGVTFKDKAN